MHAILKTSQLFDKYYYKRKDFISGTKAFHDLCASRTSGSGVLLEIGAGPSNATSKFLASLGPICGLDVSAEVAGNDALTSWRLFDGRVMPLNDNSVDYCFSNWVLEHVESPLEHFREVRRVLRPGGAYCFRTMNAHHYVGAVSRFSPYWFHRAVANRLRAVPRMAHDPWPTFYRCNTLGALHRVARKAGFEEIDVTMIEAEPSYAKASPLLFYPMLLWERTVNATDALRFLRAGILGTVKKASTS